jgi:hypothetical protein
VLHQPEHVGEKTFLGPHITPDISLFITALGYYIFRTGKKGKEIVSGSSEGMEYTQLAKSNKTKDISPL